MLPHEAFKGSGRGGGKEGDDLRRSQAELSKLNQKAGLLHPVPVSSRP